MSRDMKRRETSKGCFEQYFEMDSVRQEMAGKEFKFVELLREEYGIGLRWAEDLKDGYRIQAWSDARELIDALEGRILQILEDPTLLSLMMPFYQEIVEIDQNLASIINNEDGKVRKWLERELGLEIKAKKQYNKNFLYAGSLDEDVIAVFNGRINQIRLKPESFETQIRLISEKKVHVFVDVSNIMIGSKRDPITGELDFSVRMDCKNLLELVCGMRQPIRKVVIGSTPSKDSIVWERWREAGWTDVRILERILDTDGRNVEQAVDDVLHAAMSQDIMLSYPKPRTLVLLTGDGNANGGYTSFPGVIQSALMRGWLVELWSWDISTANIYEKFRKAYPDHFFLRRLDQYRDYLTFKTSKDVMNRVAASSTPIDPSSGSENKKATSNKDNNYNGNAKSVSKSQDFEVMASPENTMKRLYLFIITSSENNSISAFDLKAFYDDYPECKQVIIHFGLPYLCSQSYAMNILKFVEGSQYAGNGIIYAIQPGHPPHPTHTDSQEKPKKMYFQESYLNPSEFTNSIPEETTIPFLERAAQQIHEYILQTHCNYIDASELYLFYIVKPEYEELITDLRISFFCSQPYANHLLRWEYDKDICGGGRVHAITDFKNNIGEFNEYNLHENQFMNNGNKYSHDILQQGIGNFSEYDNEYYKAQHNDEHNDKANNNKFDDNIVHQSQYDDIDEIKAQKYDEEEFHEYDSSEYNLFDNKKYSKKYNSDDDFLLVPEDMAVKAIISSNAKKLNTKASVFVPSAPPKDGGEQSLKLSIGAKEWKPSATAIEWKPSTATNGNIVTAVNTVINRVSSLDCAPVDTAKIVKVVSAFVGENSPDNASLDIISTAVSTHFDRVGSNSTDRTSVDDSFTLNSEGVDLSLTARRFKQKFIAATMLRDYILTLQYDYMKPDKICSFYDRYKEEVLINGLSVNLKSLIGESCNDVMEFSSQFPKLFAVRNPKDPNLAYMCSITARHLSVDVNLSLLEDNQSYQSPSLAASSLSPFSLDNCSSSSDKVDDDDKIKEDEVFSADKGDANDAVDDECNGGSNDNPITNSSSGHCASNAFSSATTKIEDVAYNIVDNRDYDVDDITEIIAQELCDVVPLCSDDAIDNVITDLATAPHQEIDGILESNEKSSIDSSIIDSNKALEKDYYVASIINEEMFASVDPKISVDNDIQSIDGHTHMQETKRDISSVSPYIPIPSHSANNDIELADSKEESNEECTEKKSDTNSDFSQSLSMGSSQNMNMDLLMCPICLEIMVDPMLTPYGDSFERSAILDWLQRNDTCPLTRRPLTVNDLSENIVVKTIIQEYQAHKQKQQKEQESRKNQQIELDRLLQQIEDMQNSMKIDSLDNFTEANTYDNQFLNNRSSSDSDHNNVKNFSELNADYTFQGDEESFRSDDGFKLEDCKEEFKEEYEFEYKGEHTKDDHHKEGREEEYSEKYDDIRYSEDTESRKENSNQKYDESFKNMDPSSSEIYELLQHERIKLKDNTDNSLHCKKNSTNISSLYELLQEQEKQSNNDSAGTDYHELIRQQQQIYEELKSKSTESTDDFEMTEEFIEEQKRIYEQLTSNQHTSLDSSSSQSRRNQSSYSKIASDTYETPSSSKISKPTTSKVKVKSSKNVVLSDIVPEVEICTTESCHNPYCQLLHWPKKMCDMSNTCTNKSCCKLHRSQMKYTVMNGHIRTGIKRDGFNTIPNGGKK